MVIVFFCTTGRGYKIQLLTFRSAVTTDYVLPISAISGQRTTHHFAGFHCYIFCASWQNYLWDNYYIVVVLYRLVGTMGKQKRELPLRETASGTVRCWSDGTHDCAVKDVHEDGQLRSSTTSSTWQGLMPTSYSWSISSRRARRKVLQQLTEELRAEYMVGKAAAAVGTRWVAVEATTAAAVDTDTQAGTGPARFQLFRLL